MSTPIEPKELGTLIVVVGKAVGRFRKLYCWCRNCLTLLRREIYPTSPVLANKIRFVPSSSVKKSKKRNLLNGTSSWHYHSVHGKDSYLHYHRGGQHPEWDEEFRFAILEDVEDVVQRSESQSESLNSSLNGKPLPVPDDPGVITTAALASKSRKIKKKGGKSMKVACFADDAKEPELIGDCVVSLEDVLKKGEVDGEYLAHLHQRRADPIADWYDFQYKEKYSGEIYLELTFFSNVRLTSSLTAQKWIHSLNGPSYRKRPQ